MHRWYFRYEFFFYHTDIVLGASSRSKCAATGTLLWIIFHRTDIVLGTPSRRSK